MVTRGASRHKLVLPMVGLPARGKSSVGNKLVNFLRWRGLNVKLFNVGKKRRDTLGTENNAASSDFFDASNQGAKSRREQLAMTVLAEMTEWLKSGGDVAVFDATNTTRNRREKITSYLDQQFGRSKLEVIFIECICNDPKILYSNMVQKVRSSPDYRGKSLEDALEDLHCRIENYKHVYEPLSDKYEPDTAYIKLIDLQSKVVAKNVRGSVAHLIVSFLMSLHIQTRPIYLVRSGHCETTTTMAGENAASAAQACIQPKKSKNSISHDNDDDVGSCTADDGSSTAPLAATPARYNYTAPTPQPTSHKQRDTRGIESELHTISFPLDWSAALTLSEQGQNFSRALAEFISARIFELNTPVQDVSSPHTPVIFSSFQISSTDTEAQKPLYPNRIAITSSTLPRTLQTGSILAEHLRKIHYSTVTTESVADASPVSDECDDMDGSSLPRLFTRIEGDAWSALNPMDTGIYAGVPLQQLQDVAPQEFFAWRKSKDPVRHRITGGESIYDVMVRLEPAVVDLEREQSPAVIVTHLSIIQILLAYFRGLPLADSVSIAVPQHTAIEIIPTNYGYVESVVEFMLPSAYVPSSQSPAPRTLFNRTRSFKDEARICIEEESKELRPGWGTSAVEQKERQLHLEQGVVARQRILRRPFGHYDEP